MRSPARLPARYARASPQMRAATLAELRSAGHTWAAIARMVGASTRTVHADWRTGRGALRMPHHRRIVTVALLISDLAACYASGRREFLADPIPPGAAPVAEHHARAEAAYAAYRTCLSCPVAAECRELVDPVGGRFSGVAGARIYHHGAEVTDHIREIIYHLRHVDSAPCPQCAMIYMAG